MGREVGQDGVRYAWREYSVFRGGISDQADYSVNGLGAVWGGNLDFSLIPYIRVNYLRSHKF